MNIYLLLKLIHICAVILFLGNISLGLFWMKQADRTGDRAVISFTMKTIIVSDRWFTVPGVLLITAGGFAAAIHAGISVLRTGWIFWPIVLFSISGILFGWKLAPLQQKLFRLAASSPDQFDRAQYKSLLRQWEFWGLWATLAPVAALVMMVLKIPVTSIF